jgi:serine protease Do
MRKRLYLLEIAFPILFIAVFYSNALSQENLPKLVKKIQPAVVTVITYDASGRVKGQGSGFFIIKNGAFITNYHVLAGAPRARVQTADGRQYPVVGIVVEDKDGDLVVGAVNPPPEGFPSLKMGAALPEAGERVVVVGSPLGLEQTISDGVVSGTRQLSGVGEILQISAPISPGSSGSPVVNLRGEVVGVATLQIVKGQNLNFAVPGYRVLALQQRAATLVAPKKRMEDMSDEELAKIAGVKLLPPVAERKKGAPTKQPSGSAEIFFKQAGKFYEAKNYEKAVEALSQGIRLQPDNDRAYAMLGAIYSIMGRHQEALFACRDAIRLKPDNASVFGLIGESYSKLGRHGEALEAYKQAIRLQPDNPGVHGSLGATYLILGNRGAALEEYKILKNLNPKLAEELFNLIYQ